MTTDIENADVYENGDIIVEGEQPRKLDDLLKLETFQDMSDDEIRLVIAYKQLNAYNQKRIEEERKLNDERIAEIKRQSEISRKQSNENFERALKLIPQFETVEEV